MSTLQPSFFDDDPSVAADDALVPRPTSNRPRTRQEKAFERLLRNVQSLGTQLEHEKRRLDDALAFHAAEIRPRIERAIGLRKELVRRLAPFLDDRQLKANDRGLLKTIIAEQLDDVLMHRGHEPLEQDLRDLFGRIHGVGFDEAVQEELDEARTDMSALFAELGLDVDMPELRASMSEEEIAASSAEMADRVRKQMEDAIERESARPVGKRAQRAQARLDRLEEVRKRGLSAVYRRLVKELHPDLESDADLRARKQQQMQEVTAAYGRRDLVTLLRLESEWLEGERAADAARLSADTLASYTEILKEQVAELEWRLSELLLQPRYEPVVRFAGPFGDPVVIDGCAEVECLDRIVELAGRGVEQLSSDDARLHVRGVIDEHRRVARDQSRELRGHRRRRGRRTRAR